MRIKQKIVLFIICILMMGIVSASAEIIRPMYVAISSFTCTLSISSGKALCTVSLMPSSSSFTPSLSLALKRSSDGVSWTSVESWSATGSGILGVTIQKSVSVFSGYQYKLFATGTVKNSNGTVIETAYKNSPIITY